MATLASDGPSSTARTAAALPVVPEDDVASLPAKNTLLLVIGIMTASLLQILDTTIANVAIPHMRASLGATPDEISWVLTSYIVASAVAMPITGWLADRIGSRNLFIYSTAGFVISSMLCGMSQNITEMVLFRALQGMTGAFISPLSQTAMLDINRPSRRAQMMAIWGSGIMIGPIIGPILGGWLTDNWNWRWVFYVNVPLGAIALAILLTGLPSRPRTARKFDTLGYAMIALCISALQLLLDRGNHLDWFDSIEVWIYAFIIGSTAWIGAVHFATAKGQILFDRLLFADRNFIVSMLFMLVLGLVMFASMALLPTMLQQLYGYSVVGTGMAMMPRGVGTLISMQLSGVLVRKQIDSRLIVITGFVLTALSFWDMAGWSLGTDQRHIITAGLVQGLGIGLVFIPLNTAAFATLSAALRTEGSSLLNLFRSLGASVGISITTALLARNLQQSHSDLAGHVTASVTDLVDFSSLDRFQQLGTTVLSVIDAAVNRQAAMIAYVDNFYLMMWLSLAATPLALLMQRASTAQLPSNDIPH